MDGAGPGPVGENLRERGEATGESATPPEGKCFPQPHRYPVQCRSSKHEKEGTVGKAGVDPSLACRFQEPPGSLQ